VVGHDAMANRTAHKGIRLQGDVESLGLGDHSGAMCHLIPRRVGVLAAAIISFLAGVLGFVYYAFELMKTAVNRPMHTATCHVGNCDMEIYDILTCPNTSAWTLHTQAVLIIVGGIVFGFLGTRGVHDRHPEDLLAFASFLVACSVIGLGCLAVDAVYVSYCDKAPDLWLLVLGVIYPAKMALLARMGYHPATTPLDEMSLVFGFDVELRVVLSYVFLLCLFAYLAYHSYWLSRLCLEGPACCGPMYGIEIDHEVVREWHQCVHDLMDAGKKFAHEHDDTSVPIAQLQPSWLEGGHGDRLLPVNLPAESVEYGSVTNHRAGTERETMRYHHVDHYGSTDRTDGRD